MSQCCQSPTIRIERIRENLKKQSEEEEYTYSNNAFTAEGVKKRASVVIDENRMTDFFSNVDMGAADTPTVLNPEFPNAEIPITDSVGNVEEVIPNAPTFRVPANPLLPPQYREIIDYNDLQYANGFFRTQIGHFVKVDCLVGSNQIITKMGFLVGVGLNYILLQDATGPNITTVDFYSIKFMYIYYDEKELQRVMPFA